MVADTGAAARPARSTRAGRCCSRAARPRCSTSTTAPTRSSPRPTRRPAARAPGSGIPPTRIDRVIAIVKAYTTRVGEGPFPTELLDDDGERLRKVGGEFGTTTGRPRRCGWYDVPIARYAARVNGVTDFVLTKLDVLTGWDQLPVCVAYDVDGERIDELPVNQTDFHHARPVYEYLPGLDRGHLQGARRSTTCRPTRGRTSTSSRSARGRRSPRSASGPGRDETIVVRPLV